MFLKYGLIQQHSCNIISHNVFIILLYSINLENKPMFMKPISNCKNLPDIKDKKSALRSAKASLIVQNSSFISFQNVNQIIINTETLPIQLITESIEWKQLHINVNTANIAFKNSQQTYNLPLPVDKKKWLKLIFGKQNVNIQVRSRYNQNKINKKNIFGSFMAWKNVCNEEYSQLTSLNIQFCLTCLKQKINSTAKSQIKNQGKISGFIKNKITQRKGANNQKPKSILMKFSENSIHTACSNQLNQYSIAVESIQKNSTKQTTAVSLKKFHDRKERLTKRQINTSVQNRVNQTVSRLVNMKLIKNNTNTSEITPIVFPKEEQLETLKTLSHQKRYRPRFCQEIPLSYEEIQLKRKKFDSQFMTKVTNTTTNIEVDIKTNESEVTQQIVKQDGSQVNNLQDTFQRGICNNNNNQQNNNNQCMSNSGTLCESVFQ